MDESKPIKASEIVNDPDMIYRLVNYYVMVKDTSIGGSFKNLIEAMNLFAERGWEVVALTHGDSSGNMHALCKNPHAKSKFE
jgi:hypothetical protein